MPRKSRKAQPSFDDANRFIRAEIRGHVAASFVDYYLHDGWVAYKEAEVYYPKFAGCCTFAEYAALYIAQAIDELRRQNNARMSVESRHSLDTENSEEDAAPRRYLAVVGDCSNIVSLRDYIDRQNAPERYITKKLYRGYTPEEIVESGRFSDCEFQHYMTNIQAHFRRWQEIA